jgi:hypothetical protein
VADVAAKTIEATLKGGDALKKHLTTIASKLGRGAAVKVGFLESETYPGGTYHFSKAARKGMSPETAAFADFLEGKQKFSGPVAQVAFWNEFGTKRTPPRPFMRNTVASKSPRWGNALGRALRDTKYDAHEALALVGQGIQGQIREAIIGWTDPPNSKITRELKGRNSPLRDSGVMLRAVDYQVTDEMDE